MFAYSRFSVEAVWVLRAQFCWYYD